MNFFTKKIFAIKNIDKHNLKHSSFFKNLLSINKQRDVKKEEGKSAKKSIFKILEMKTDVWSVDMTDVSKGQEEKMVNTGFPLIKRVNKDLERLVLLYEVCKDLDLIRNNIHISNKMWNKLMHALNGNIDSIASSSQEIRRDALGLKKLPGTHKKFAFRNVQAARKSVNWGPIEDLMSGNRFLEDFDQIYDADFNGNYDFVGRKIERKNFERIMDDDISIHDSPYFFDEMMKRHKDAIGNERGRPSSVVFRSIDWERIHSEIKKSDIVFCCLISNKGGIQSRNHENGDIVFYLKKEINLLEKNIISVLWFFQDSYRFDYDRVISENPCLKSRSKIELTKRFPANVVVTDHYSSGDELWKSGIHVEKAEDFKNRLIKSKKLNSPLHEFVKPCSRLTDDEIWYESSFDAEAYIESKQDTPEDESCIQVMIRELGIQFELIDKNSFGDQAYDFIDILTKEGKRHLFVYMKEYKIDDKRNHVSLIEFTKSKKFLLSVFVATYRSSKFYAAKKHPSFFPEITDVFLDKEDQEKLESIDFNDIEGYINETNKGNKPLESETSADLYDSESKDLIESFSDPEMQDYEIQMSITRACEIGPYLSEQKELDLAGLCKIESNNRQLKNSDVVQDWLDDLTLNNKGDEEKEKEKETNLILASENKDHGDETSIRKKVMNFISFSDSIKTIRGGSTSHDISYEIELLIGKRNSLFSYYYKTELKRINTIGDGLCLFYSLSKSAGLQGLKELPNLLEVMKSLGKNDWFGGDEIRLVCKIFNLSVILYDGNEKTIIPFNLDLVNSRVLFIHLENQHYESVVSNMNRYQIKNIIEINCQIDDKRSKQSDIIKREELIIEETLKLEVTPHIRNQINFYSFRTEIRRSQGGKFYSFFDQEITIETLGSVFNLYDIILDEFKLSEGAKNLILNKNIRELKKMNIIPQLNESPNQVIDGSLLKDQENFLTMDFRIEFKKVENMSDHYPIFFDYSSRKRMFENLALKRSNFIETECLRNFYLNKSIEEYISNQIVFIKKEKKIIDHSIFVNGVKSLILDCRGSYECYFVDSENDFNQSSHLKKTFDSLILKDFLDINTDHFKFISSERKSGVEIFEDRNVWLLMKEILVNSGCEGLIMKPNYNSFFKQLEILRIEKDLKDRILYERSERIKRKNFEEEKKKKFEEETRLRNESIKRQELERLKEEEIRIERENEERKRKKKEDRGELREFGMTCIERMVWAISGEDEQPFVYGKRLVRWHTIRAAKGDKTFRSMLRLFDIQTRINPNIEWGYYEGKRHVCQYPFTGSRTIKLASFLNMFGDHSFYSNNIGESIGLRIRNPSLSLVDRLSELMTTQWESDLIGTLAATQRLLDICYQHESEDRISVILHLEEIENFLNFALSDFDNSVRRWKSNVTERMSSLSRSDVSIIADIIQLIMTSQKLDDPTNIEVFCDMLNKSYIEVNDRIDLRFFSLVEKQPQFDEETMNQIMENMNKTELRQNIILLDTNIYMALWNEDLIPKTYNLTIFIPRVIVNEIRKLNTHHDGIFAFFVQFIRMNDIKIDTDHENWRDYGDQCILKFDIGFTLFSMDKDLRNKWRGPKAGYERQMFDLERNRSIINKESEAGRVLGDVSVGRDNVVVRSYSPLQKYFDLKVFNPHQSLLPDLPDIQVDKTQGYTFQSHDTSNLLDYDIDAEYNDDWLKSIREAAFLDLSSYMNQYTLVNEFSPPSKLNLFNKRRHELRENFGGNESIIFDNVFKLRSSDSELGPLTKLNDIKFSNDDYSLIESFRLKGVRIFQKRNLVKLKKRWEDQGYSKRRIENLRKEELYLYKNDHLPYELNKNHTTNRYKVDHSESNTDLIWNIKEYAKFDFFKGNIIGTTPEIKSYQSEAQKVRHWQSSELEDFSTLHTHMIHDFVRKAIPKNMLLVNHNNFHRFGYIIYRSAPSRTMNRKKIIRYFFLDDGKSDKNNKNENFFPEFILEGDHGLKMNISRTYSLSLSDVIYRSNLYVSLQSISLFESIEFDKIYWTLFFRSKNVSSLLSFFKFYNTISNSTYAKLPNLVDKYLSILPKRASEEWLLQKILWTIQGLKKNEARTMFSKPRDVHELLELGNLYSFVPTDITDSTANYRNFFFDIRKNIKKASVLCKNKEDLMDNIPHPKLKSMSPKAFSASLDLFLSKVPIPSEEEILSDMESDFNTFFNSTTRGLDPFDFNKRTNALIYHRVLVEYRKEKEEWDDSRFSYNEIESQQFSIFSFLEWCFDKCKERGPVMIISIKVQKDKGDREISIQDFFTKACHFPIQTVFKTFCKKWPNELVSKSEIRKLEIIASMDFSNACYVNIDMAKWSPHDIKEKFFILVFQMKKKNIISENIFNLLIRCFDLVNDMNIFFDERCATNENLYWQKKEDLAKYGSKGPEKTIYTNKSGLKSKKGKFFTRVRMDFGWPQGLRHFVSSFVHCLECLLTEKVMHMTIEKPIKVLGLGHSDDGNKSLSSKFKLTIRDKTMLPCVSSICSLMMSLRQSETKMSISTEPSFLEINGKRQKDQFSELVSIYNMSGKIYNSWVRQSSEISKSYTHRSFNQNHLALITRIGTIQSLSNQMIWPEILFSINLKHLKKFFLEDEREIYDKTLQWGGDKAVSLRSILEFGFWSDNLIKFIDNPSSIKTQSQDPISEPNIIPDTLNRDKFTSWITIEKIKNLSRFHGKDELTDLIYHESQRIQSSKSGVFMKQNDMDFFNFYKHKNSRVLSRLSERRVINDKIKREKNVEEVFKKNIESFSTFTGQMTLEEVRRENESRVRKIIEFKKKKEEYESKGYKSSFVRSQALADLIVPHYTSSEVRNMKLESMELSYEVNELICGSEHMMEEIIEDVLNHSEFYSRANIRLEGSINRNDKKVPFAITTDYSEALDLLKDPLLFRRSVITRGKYNVVAEDIRNFIRFTGVETMEDFLDSSYLWDFYKMIGGEKKNIRMNWLKSGLAADGTFGIDTTKQLNAFLIRRELKFKRLFMPTKMRYSQRFRNFQEIFLKELQKIVIKSFLNRCKIDIGKKDYKEIYSLYSIHDLRDQLNRSSNLIVRIILHNLLNIEFDGMNRGISPIDYNQEDDTTVYLVSSGKMSDIFIKRGETTIIPSDLDRSLKRLVRGDDLEVIVNDEILLEYKALYRSQVELIPGMIKDIFIEPVKDTTGGWRMTLNYRIVTIQSESPLISINIPFRIFSDGDKSLSDIMMWVWRQGQFIEIMDSREQKSFSLSLMKLGVNSEGVKNITDEVFRVYKFNELDSIPLLPAITYFDGLLVRKKFFNYLGLDITKCYDHGPSKCLPKDGSYDTPLWCEKNRGPNLALVNRVIRKFKNMVDSSIKMTSLSNSVNYVKNSQEMIKIRPKDPDISVSDFMKTKVFYDNIGNFVEGYVPNIYLALAEIKGKRANHYFDKISLMKMQNASEIIWDSDSFEMRADDESIIPIEFKSKIRRFMMPESFNLYFEEMKKTGLVRSEILTRDQFYPIVNKIYRQEPMSTYEMTLLNLRDDDLDEILHDIGPNVYLLDDEIRELKASIEKFPNSMKSKKLKKDMTQLIVSRYGVMSPLIVQKCFTYDLDDIERRITDVGSLIIKDTRTQLCILLSNNIESDDLLVDQDQFNFKKMLQEMRQSRKLFEIKEFNPGKAVDFVRTFDRDDEGLLTYQGGEDEFSQQIRENDEEGGYIELEMTYNDVLNATYFAVEGLFTGSNLVSETEKIIRQTGLNVFTMKSLYDDLEEQQSSNRVSQDLMEIYNNWDKEIKGNKSLLSVKIISKVSEFMNNKERMIMVDTCNTIIEKRSFGTQDNLVPIHKNSGKFLITGFKSSNNISSLIFAKCVNLKLNYSSEMDKEFINEFINLIHALNQNDYDSLDDKDKVKITSIMNSISTMNRLNEFECEIKNRKYRNWFSSFNNLMGRKHLNFNRLF